MNRYWVVALLAIQLAYLPSGFGGAGQSKPKYGPAQEPIAVPLSQSHDYFNKGEGKASHFWALISFYIPQFNEYSCSAATLAMVLNAARAGVPKTAKDKVISEKELLDKFNIEHWKERLNEGGFKGKYGSSLDLLGRIAETAFKEYGFPKTRVKVLHVNSSTNEGIKAEVLKILKSKAFLLINFDQREFTDDAQVGHFAPVGAFDEKNNKVLILDPDREYYEPYWISVAAFLKGMATLDPEQNYRGLIAVFPNG
jgi:hypothetical protein